jgi:hypothetical protein
VQAHTSNIKSVSQGQPLKQAGSFSTNFRHVARHAKRGELDRGAEGAEGGGVWGGGFSPPQPTRGSGGAS